jgi:hypothetical protein
MMALRWSALLGVSLLAVLLIGCGKSAANSYPDRVGDVRGGTGPDIASVRVSSTKTKVTFGVRFAKAPPLRINPSEGWVDMLLIGVDVPPLGPRPIPLGEWRGANLALGTHGPSKTGLIVRLGQNIPAEQRQVAKFEIVTHGSTMTFSIPRRALGNPDWFTFQVAAAREMATGGQGGSADFAPAGTFRYPSTD